MKDNRLQNLIIKVGIHGLGVFAKKNFKKGSVIFKMKGKVLNLPTRTSVQIGKHKHIEDEIAKLVNHNCFPTAKVHRNDATFVAARDIHKGEEICFNYEENEDELASPFTCFCCHRKIIGKEARAAALIKRKESIA